MKPKICKLHGLLDKDQYSIEKLKNGLITRRCKVCRSMKRAANSLKKLECKVHGKLSIDLIRNDGRCKRCHRETANRKRDENREWFNAKMAKDREANPEKWKEIYRKVYDQQKAKYGSLHSLKKCCDKVGITIEHFQKIHDAQNGKCAICHLSETRINGKTKMPLRLVIDHCHKTKKFRGLICHCCNTAIGKFKDNPVIMLRAIRYIKAGGF